MKVLLINVPMSLYNNVYEYAEPLGVLYIGSYMAKWGHDVRIRDYSVDSYKKSELAALIHEFSPDVIGISFMSASYHSAKILIKDVRNIRPNIFIVLGGYHATAMPELTLQETGANVVVRGEGEITFCELIETLGCGGDLGSVNGISYLKDDMILHTAERELIKNLDNLPHPIRELLPESKYPRFNIISSRGCPFRCIYCDKSITKGKVMFRSAADIIAELKESIAKFGNKPIFFVDDHFFIHKKRLLEFFDFLEKEKLHIEWVCQSRVDSVAPDILHRAKRAGCIQIMYGIETGDPDELEYINKDATLLQAEKAIQWTKEAGIVARANFMLGFPISDRPNIERTIRFAKKIMPDLVRFFIVKPFPNTTLWDHCVKLKLIPEIIKWESFSMREFGIEICKLSDRELNRYVGAAYMFLLNDEVKRELTWNMLRNSARFLREFLKTRKVTYSIIISFPRSVNLFSELWFLVQEKPLVAKASYLRNIYQLSKRI